MACRLMPAFSTREQRLRAKQSVQVRPSTCPDKEARKSVGRPQAAPASQRRREPLRAAGGPGSPAPLLPPLPPRRGCCAAPPPLSPPPPLHRRRCCTRGCCCSAAAADTTEAAPKQLHSLRPVPACSATGSKGLGHTAAEGWQHAADGEGRGGTQQLITLQPLAAKLPGRNVTAFPEALCLLAPAMLPHTTAPSDPA
jgi:hypothetical protein